MSPEIDPNWASNPPTSIEEIAIILQNFGDRIKEQSQTGETLRFLFRESKKFLENATHKARISHPIAFFKPSYEQALILNCWIWGINFPICFASNRIGKTVVAVINAILWIFPNNPSWLMFKPYIDHFGRLVAVLPRPSINSMLPLQEYFFRNPHLTGDFYKQPYEVPNLSHFKTLQTKFAMLQLNSPYPNPPIIKNSTLWLGAPDHDWHRHTFMRRWKDWLPQSSIQKWNTTDCYFSCTTASTTNPTPTNIEIDCKSYDSESTKWSGDAVQGIILTEGFTKDILSEVKQRIINNGFMSWDYTPAEPRNTGKKVKLAYDVYKGTEQLPLKTHIFVKFSVRDAPDHIIPKEKKADLIRMWEGTSEGKARIDGDFYASSGLVLDKLDRKFHCLDWSLKTLQQKFPDGRFYRGIDPGLDHPTACCWGYLTYNNIWFIYRFYSERGKTISERCQDIVKLSNNTLQRHHTRSNSIFWREVHSRPDSEVFSNTVIDYHVFKEDENTGLAYANNYINAGLNIVESIHTKPEERAQIANSLLDPHAFPYLAHPRTELPPGARIFFLTNQPGVAKALDKMEQLFWDRLRAGENKGEPKDKVQSHGDDELDALCYLVCSPYVWSPNTPKRREPELQEQSHSSQSSQPIPSRPPTAEVPVGVGFT